MKAVDKLILGIAICMALIVVAYTGLIGHSLVASGYFDAAIAGKLDQPYDISVFGESRSISQSKKIYVEILNNGGIYNAVLMRRADGKFYFTFEAALSAAVRNAMFADVWFARFESFRFTRFESVPYPFLLPLAVHLLGVGGVRFACFGVLGRSEFKKARSYLGHAFVSSFFVLFLALWFQLARMVWANERWGVGSYLNDSISGRAGILLLVTLSVVAYLYVVFSTGGLYRVRKNKRSCMLCGYEGVGSSECCPECGSDGSRAHFLRYKVNYWILTGFFAMIFFSPVLVASVYSVLGLA